MFDHEPPPRIGDTESLPRRPVSHPCDFDDLAKSPAGGRSAFLLAFSPIFTISQFM